MLIARSAAPSRVKLTGEAILDSLAATPEPHASDRADRMGKLTPGAPRQEVIPHRYTGGSSIPIQKGEFPPSG